LSKKLTLSQTHSLRNMIDDPAFAAVLEHMQPKTLARLVDRVGLNDAAELMALVPARRLLSALDVAVWKSPGLGASQVFDAAEFTNWLRVWNDVGELFVAERLGAMSDEYLGLCLSSVLHVADGHSNELAGCTDDSGNDGYEVYGHYLLRPAYEDGWESIRGALDALWRHAPERLLHILGTLASSESMLSSDRRRASLNLDVAFERERHLERRGYVSPTGARAFLVSTSVTTLQDLLLMSLYDNETRRFLQNLGDQDNGPHPIENVMATDPADEELPQTQIEVMGIAAIQPSQEQISALHRLLDDEAIVEPKRFESLPSNDHDSGKAVLAELLDRLQGENQEAFQQRSRELAYLATVLMAGSSLEGQPFTGSEARDAALATCNLGVEFIQSRQVALKLDREPGLIRLFLIGWQMLDALRDRIIDAMKASLEGLETSQCLQNTSWLRNEARIGIHDLQKAVLQRRFADARDAAVFLSIVFDATTCRAIAPLLDHLPHFATIAKKSNNKSQPRWIESSTGLDQVSSLLSNLSK
jgi:Family of unknown function (DUF6178)